MISYLQLKFYYSEVLWAIKKVKYKNKIGVEPRLLNIPHSVDQTLRTMHMVYIKQSSINLNKLRGKQSLNIKQNKTNKPYNE